MKKTTQSLLALGLTSLLALGAAGTAQAQSRASIVAQPAVLNASVGVPAPRVVITPTPRPRPIPPNPGCLGIQGGGASRC